MSGGQEQLGFNLEQDQLYLELIGQRCRCGQPKKAGHTFCAPDYYHLPGRLSVRLYRKMGAGYEQAYSEAAAWLDEHPAGETQPAAEPRVDEPTRPTQTFEVPVGSRLSTCRGCNARIYWVRTERGRLMPVNPDKTSHFATCPKAAAFSRKKKEQP